MFVKLSFQCRFLSDVILNASSATASVSETLDYIPGSKFWGMLIQEAYRREDEQLIQALQAIGSTKIRVGDAHPMVETSQQCLKVPRCFFNKKTNKSDVYLDFLLDEYTRKALREEPPVQLKQMRKEYIIYQEEKGIFHSLNLDKKLTIKTAYDRNKRRSKDGQMYNYEALPKGSKWLFDIEIAEEEKDLISFVQSFFARGKSKRLGKSRSAEFGQVDIVPYGDASIQKEEFVEPYEISIEGLASKKLVALYAESRVAFIKDGQVTAEPQLDVILDALGIEDKGAKICLSANYMSSTVYSPWNAYRNARDADRWLLDKGSVFFIELSEKAKPLPKVIWLGGFQAEGFGKLLVNPSFLNAKHIGVKSAAELRASKDSEPLTRSKFLEQQSFQIHKQEDKVELIETAAFVEIGAGDELLVDLLEQEQLDHSSSRQLSKRVESFRRNYLKYLEAISASQWGQVRNLVTHFSRKSELEKILFDDNFGFLRTASRKKTWSNTLVKGLEDEVSSGLSGEQAREFLLLLANAEAKKVVY